MRTVCAPDFTSFYTSFIFQHHQQPTTNNHHARRRPPLNLKLHVSRTTSTGNPAYYQYLVQTFTTFTTTAMPPIANPYLKKKKTPGGGGGGGIKKQGGSKYAGGKSKVNDAAQPKNMFSKATPASVASSQSRQIHAPRAASQPPRKVPLITPTKIQSSKVQSSVKMMIPSKASKSTSPHKKTLVSKKSKGSLKANLKREIAMLKRQKAEKALAKQRKKAALIQEEKRKEREAMVAIMMRERELKEEKRRKMKEAMILEQKEKLKRELEARGLKQSNEGASRVNNLVKVVPSYKNAPPSSVTTQQFSKGIITNMHTSVNKQVFSPGSQTQAQPNLYGQFMNELNKLPQSQQQAAYVSTVKLSNPAHSFNPSHSHAPNEVQTNSTPNAQAQTASLTKFDGCHNLPTGTLHVPPNSAVNTTLQKEAVLPGWQHQQPNVHTNYYSQVNMNQNININPYNPYSIMTQQYHPQTHQQRQIDIHPSFQQYPSTSTAGVIPLQNQTFQYPYRTAGISPSLPLKVIQSQAPVIRNRKPKKMSASEMILCKPLLPPSPFAKTYSLLPHKIVIVKKAGESFGIDLRYCKKGTFVEIKDLSSENIKETSTKLDPDVKSENTNATLVTEVKNIAVKEEPTNQECREIRVAPLNQANQESSKEYVLKVHPDHAVSLERKKDGSSTDLRLSVQSEQACPSCCNEINAIENTLEGQVVTNATTIEKMSVEENEVHGTATMKSEPLSTAMLKSEDSSNNLVRVPVSTNKSQVVTNAPTIENSLVKKNEAHGTATMKSEPPSSAMLKSEDSSNNPVLVPVPTNQIVTNAPTIENILVKQNEEHGTATMKREPLSTAMLKSEDSSNNPVLVPVPTNKKRSRRLQQFGVMSVVSAEKQNSMVKVGTSKDRMLQSGDIIVEINGKDISEVILFHEAAKLIQKSSTRRSECDGNNSPKTNTESSTSTKDDDMMIVCVLSVARERKVTKLIEKLAALEKSSGQKLSTFSKNTISNVQIPAQRNPTHLVPSIKTDSLVVPLPIKIPFIINDRTGVITSGEFSDNEMKALVNGLMEADGMLDKTVFAKIMANPSYQSMLIHRTEFDLRGKWMFDTSSINSRLEINALNAWTKEWEKETKGKSDDLLSISYLSLAQRSAMRNVPRPSRGCKCGNLDHQYVSDKECVLYRNLRKWARPSILEMKLNPVDDAISSIRKYDGKLNGIGNAQVKRFIKKSKEQKAEEMEAKFVDEMERIQTEEQRIAIFSPGLLGIMVLSSVAEFSKTSEDDSTDDNEELLLSDDDEDDVPLMALGVKRQRKPGEINSPSGKRNRRNKLGSASNPNSYSLARILAHMGKTWGHLYQQPSQSEAKW